MKRLIVICAGVLLPVLALLILAPRENGAVQAASQGYKAPLDMEIQAFAVTSAPPSKPAPTRAPTLAPTQEPTPEPTPLLVSTLPPTLEPTPTPIPKGEILAEDEGLPPESENRPSYTLPPLLPADGWDELCAQPHYIPENEARYRDYLAAHPQYSARLLVSLVNVNADRGNYQQVAQISDPADLLALCNKNYQLPQTYTPERLCGVMGTTFQLRSEAATAMEQMVNAMKAELGLTLKIISSYRSFAYQENLYAYYADRNGAASADRYSARAGFSEHQTGLAADVGQKKSTSGLRALNFESTSQYAWLIKNAHRYGYILRYPEGFEQITGYIYEPWHWRYIGTEHATAMHVGGFTVFEEYVGFVLYRNERPAEVSPSPSDTPAVESSAPPTPSETPFVAESTVSPAPSDDPLATEGAVPAGESEVPSESAPSAGGMTQPPPNDAE